MHDCTPTRSQGIMAHLRRTHIPLLEILRCATKFPVDIIRSKNVLPEISSI